MSSSMSVSSVILGLAKTENPTFLTASIQGLMTSELPGVMLVKMAPWGVVFVVWACWVSHLPMASNRGRYWALGLVPRIAPSPMSMFGASQMRRVVFVFMVVCFLVVGLVGGVFEDEGVVCVDEVFGECFVDVVCPGGVVGCLGGVVHVFCEDACECFDCSLGGGVDVDVGGVTVECDGDVFHWVLPFVSGFGFDCTLCGGFCGMWVCSGQKNPPPLSLERGRGFV